MTDNNDLIIVESPTKVRTIQRLLGPGYQVMATMGHVRDLPSSELGIDIESGFDPKFETIKGKGKILSAIKKAAGGASRILLAPDPDREGEAIASHVAMALGKNQDRVYRIMINEITSRGLKEALSQPGRIDSKRVEAQLTRRVLDRLVGYQLSPLLWKKVRRGLSAGRVQSVTLKFLCDREDTIEVFVPREYWTISADLEGTSPPVFRALLTKWDDKKLSLGSEADSQRTVETLKKQVFRVASVKTSPRKVSPPPPLITSLLQQEGWKRFRMPAKKTMRIAQSLYEGVDLPDGQRVGLITYMRTDSFRVASEAVAEAREHIQAEFGKDYLPANPPRFKTKGPAQEAHEAIRPTSVARTPESIAPSLTPDQRKIYNLIWRRFVASQMKPQLQEVTKVQIEAGPGELEAKGSVIIFEGFRKVLSLPKKEEENGDNQEKDGILPALTSGEVLSLKEIAPEQRFTQPLPRYTEASLIKELEEKGIGRPSTYAAIISILLDRDYAARKKGQFHPTPLGRAVNDLLVPHFPDLIRADFTARMEADLDAIEEGKIKDRLAVLSPFWETFSKSLSQAEKEMTPLSQRVTKTDLDCPKCGQPLVIRWGRNGEFLACSGYPQCRFTSPVIRKDDGSVTLPEEKPAGKNCPKCGQPMVVKTGRFGSFLACGAYPDCKTTLPLGTGISCPVESCGGELVLRRGKKGPFTGCSRYPSCKYIAWGEPLPGPCPECNFGHLSLKRRRGKKEIVCPAPGCSYRREEEP